MEVGLIVEGRMKNCPPGLRILFCEQMGAWVCVVVGKKGGREKGGSTYIVDVLLEHCKEYIHNSLVLLLQLKSHRGT